MITSNLYNLRKQYLPMTKEQKDQSHSKSKVYTFNQNDLHERSILAQNLPQRQNFNLSETQKPKPTHSAVKYEQAKIKNFKNKENLQSSPSQLHRYLKEYQYNCYKIDQNDPSNTKHYQKKITEDCFSSDKKLGITQKYETKSSKQIQGFSLHDSKTKNALNCSLSNEFSGAKERPDQTFDNLSIVKGGRNLSQQLQNRIHSIPSKTLTFKDLTQESKHEPLCSKQELALIKMLRLQISELKTQIQTKNVYIRALEEKLQSHLIERIEVQKIVDQNTILLENKIRLLEMETERLQEKWMSCQNELIHWKRLGQKNPVLFSSLEQVSSKSVFKLNERQIQQCGWGLMEKVSQLETYKKLIRKVDQMRRKIEKINNLDSSENGQVGSAWNEKQVCLKDLWKWLKRVGKEYEIMKQRVLVLENNFLVG